MFERNKARVKNLTGLEIWFFIVGRVLAGFVLAFWLRASGRKSSLRLALQRLSVGCF